MSVRTTATRVGQALLIPVWLVTTGLLAVVVARVVAFDRFHLFMLADAFTLWIYLPAYLVLGAALCFRSWPLSVAAGVVVLAHLVWILAPVLHTVEVPAAARSAPRLRIVTANLEFSNGNVALLREISGFDADIVMLQEVTPEWWKAISTRGLVAAYPHHAQVLRRGGSGLALLSRAPLRDVRIHPIDRRGTMTMTATVTVGERRVHLANVHPVAPITEFARNQHQQQRITSLVGHLPRPRIVAGDFNATMDNKWLADLVDLGLHEAHEAVGHPFATTWPNGERPVPPVRIDHVLADDALVPLHAAEGRGSGSDHRPVVVDIAVTSAGDGVVAR